MIMIYLAMIAALAAWLISKLPSKKQARRQSIQDHGLHGSNRERAINQTLNWR